MHLTRLLLTYMCINAYAEERTILDDLFLPLYRALKLEFTRNLFRQSRSSEINRLLRSRKKFQEIIPKSVAFPCPLNNTRSPMVPKSVHELRPGDIDVIGAIGDSLTAGNGLGAVDLMGVLLEERGRAFSAGGEKTWKEFLTLPNILKEFNPKLFGYALRASITIEEASQFNLAEGGAISSNTPYMTKVLINRILKDKRVKLWKHWKMITYMIGDNDFCSEICYYKDPEILMMKHKSDLLQSLRLIRDNLPKTIVNVIPPPHLEVLLNLKGKPTICAITHSVECPCIIGLSFVRKREYYLDFMKRWQQLDMEIANYHEFDRQDFTVVAQPFTYGYRELPRLPNGNTDYSYLSEDCFHFSQKGNAFFANALWNSIMEPIGKKSVGGYHLFEKFLCPSEEHPYIFTRGNSNF